MRFDDRLLDDIRARVTLSDLIGRSVALKRSGREFQALSPFNKERTPSFYVNDEKRLWKDFSSGKGGDCFKWLMESEGLSFPEAVGRLAEETGVRLPEDDLESRRRQERVRGLSDWVEAAAGFFRAALASRAGGEARAYLGRRGLTAADAERFELGWAPDGWTKLKDDLVARGAPLADLAAAGLIAESRTGREPFDYFRNRIMFAIRDPAGRLVAFGGRALDPDDKAKYLNSPEGPLFHKGSTLYRYKEARTALARAGAAERPSGLIVAEGYMDVIALARAGFEHAVAPLGTALTDSQLDLLWRAGGEPTLCFDGDDAGKRAAERALDRALPKLAPGRSLRFAFIPSSVGADGRPRAKDPDDVIREQGRAAMAAILDDARPIVEVLWTRERDREALDTPERRAGLRARLFAAAKSIEDEGVQAEYRRDLLDRFDTLLRADRPRRGPPPLLRRPGRAVGWRDDGAGRLGDLRDVGAAPETAATAADFGGRLRSAEAMRLMRALFERPQLIEFVAEALAQLEFADPAFADARDALLDCAFLHESIDKAVIDRHFADQGKKDIATRICADRDVAAAPLIAADTPEGEARSAWLRAASEFGRLARRDAERGFLMAEITACRERADRDGMMRAVRALSALNRTTAEDA